MESILTLTVNPCIDSASETETIYPTRKMRTTNERYDPGGGGINVARVVCELGGDALAVYLAGGATGPILDALMRHACMEFRRLGINGRTRISQMVRERSTGLEYRFVPEGPEVTRSEWETCLGMMETLNAAYFVASGSLPRGIPADFYVRVSEIAARKGAKFVLDTSGAALRETLAAGGVYLVKPSLGELEQLAGGKLATPAEQDAAALSYVRSGKAEFVAVTMGHNGALLAHRGGVLRRGALPVKAVSAVGAGDSFTAAMTLGLARGLAPEAAFLSGMAAGTAAVLTPGTALCTRKDVERLYAELQRQAAS